jgi:hypothetical protein
MSKTSTTQNPKDETPQREPRESSSMWAAMEALRASASP